MKILWVKSDFLHPTNGGGQIRTLETLKRLHRGTKFTSPRSTCRSQPRASPQLGILHESVSGAASGSAKIQRTAILWQSLPGPLDRIPLPVLRYRSRALLRQVETLTRREKFDAIVCDFLASAANIPELGNAVLFQHNVESSIWKRHTEHAPTPWHRAYCRGQYERMLRYEGRVCRAAKKIIAVSGADAREMQSLYGASRIASVPTGVDIEYFSPPARHRASHDLVFLGSMDWRPNIDGLKWFVSSVLPLIRARLPEFRCPWLVAGRLYRPNDSRIHVTGTVEDVRPYLWKSAVSIVPLRIGGGTRLKIYEAMAAKIPVVSTSVGAEGLDVRDGENIQIADSPEAFAERCIALLSAADARRKQSQAAWEMVSACYSWEVISRKFEQLLA